VAGSAFGVLLRRHRLAAGLSQEALAERARMSAVGIGALERGDRRSPYRETVALIAKALSLSPSAAAELEAAAHVPHRPLGRLDRKAEVADGPGRATNLPPARTSLVGRAAEITDIVELLQGNRLVTVTGAGGIGKTRMATAAGDALIDGTEAGVWFVELAPLAQGSSVASTVVQGLGLQESPNRPLLATLVAHLEQKSLLLILDNCEHVIAEAAALADALLRGCARLQILATSREPLRIAGEHTYRLPSLGVPLPQETPRLRAAEAAGYAAVVLFDQRARAIDHRFVLSDDNAPIVAQICRELDGIPLAIELAAARVKILSVQALSTKLAQRLQLLTGGDRTALPRHQTMRALIDWSYDLLSPPEQRLFERLSIFAGGCTLATAAAVYSDDAVDEFGVLELLTSLVDKSLLVADMGADESRYQLLESTRQYAHAKLAERGETTLIAHRHASVHVDLAERLRREYHAAPNLAWLARAALELENWKAALAWTLETRGDVVLGQRLAPAMFPVWSLFSIAQGRRWMRAALDLVDERTPAVLVARMELADAALTLLSNEFEAALAGSRRVLEMCHELGEPLLVARAQNMAGVSTLYLGRDAEAERLLRSVLEATRAAGDLLTGCWVMLEGLARARCRAGDMPQARAYVTEARATFKAIGADLYAHRPALLLAEIEFQAGNVELAVELSTSGLAKRRGPRSSYLAIQLHLLAAYLVACDRWDDARARADEALEIACETQHHVVLGWTIQHLASIAALSPPIDQQPQLERLAGVARLLGYVDARIAALSPRQYITQQEYDRVISVLRDTMSTDELANVMLAGAAMNDDEAIAAARSL
jgi:predicted ATPase/DNA-binding XRE family transcriptional regulator